VNTTTAGDQFAPSVAALAGGGYVVVWDSTDVVQAQIYDARDQKLGGEVAVFRSNPQGATIDGRPAVAGLPDGSFIVTTAAWTVVASSPRWSFYAQRVDAGGHLIATGTPASAEFNGGLSALVAPQNNSGDSMDSGRIFVRPDGSYSISYWNAGRVPPFPSRSVLIQNYTPSGSPVGAAVSPAFGSQVFGDSIAQFPNGNFLTAAVRTGPAGGISWSITTQAGEQVAHEDMPANFGGPFFDTSPMVTTLSDGTGLLLWQHGSTSSLSDTTLMAQRLDAEGAKLGAPVTLPLAQNAAPFYSLRVVSVPDGGFLVTWTSSANGPVFARFFDNTAAAVTDAFQIASDASSPEYAVWPVNGGFVAAFAAPGTQAQDIFAERFVATH
jgi:hypothetical protein